MAKTQNRNKAIYCFIKIIIFNRKDNRVKTICKTIAVKVLLIYAFPAGAQPKATAHVSIPIKKVRKVQVLKALHKAAEWQLNLPFVGKPRWNENKMYDWVYGTFYAGLSDLYKYTREEKYLQEMIALGKSTDWEPRPRPYDANEYAIVQTYSDVFEVTKDTAMIDKSRFMAKMPLLRYLDIDLRFKDHKHWQDWWSWCDALFMAPPAFAKLGRVLNKPEFHKYMSEHWWKTSEYLYSKNDSLYYRDDTFFDQKTKNGKNVFWSRGNGWVMGGLCRVLDEIPESFEARKKFEQQFVEMAYKIASLQTSEGFWPSSLLDAESYPGKESSGTAFYCYALAWGINNGLLEKDTFYPIVENAWEFLISALHPSGKLGYVQQIGDQPGNATYEDEQAYGVGAFLMAGVELAELLDKEAVR